MVPIGGPLHVVVVPGGVGQRAGEFVRNLIRREQEPDALREALLKGASSPAAVPADAEYYRGLRDRFTHSGGE